MKPDHPERALVLSNAPKSARAALAALLLLDDALGQILRTTREPVVGQMRLTWWFDALTALDVAPPPAQPVLQALVADVLSRGVSGAALAGMINGWEALLAAEAFDDVELDAYARGRGGVLYRLAGQVLGADDEAPLAEAGAGWALVDLARHVRDPAVANRARVAAQARLCPALARRWSRPARALGALAHSARLDLEGHALPGAPRRVARLAWHRLSGR